MLVPSFHVQTAHLLLLLLIAHGSMVVDCFITIINPITLDLEGNFSTNNAFDKKDSYSLENFAGIIIPLHIERECKPLLNISLNNPPFNSTSKLRPLFMLSWNQARRTGCLNQGEVKRFFISECCFM